MVTDDLLLNLKVNRRNRDPLLRKVKKVKTTVLKISYLQITTQRQ